MYEHLDATKAERRANLASFKSRVGNWNIKRWSDITRDELNDIKVKY